MVATAQICAGFRLSAHVVREEAELWSLASDWKYLFYSAECSNTNLVAVAPLYISKVWKPLSLRKLGLLSDNFVGSDHLDFLVEKRYLPEALESIRNLIIDQRKEWDFIEFASASPNSVALLEFQNMLDTAQMKILRTDSSVCPYLRLPGTTEEYWSSLRPKLRKNLRYQTRALQRDGELNFVTIEDPSEMTGALDDLLRLHQLRSDRRGRNSTFLDPKVAPFHRAALQALFAEGGARIFFLKLSGKRIAALYGFSTGRKFCYYQSGADPAYSRFSVGSLLISSVIEWAIRNGHDEFDFLRGDEPYKQLWANGSTQLQDVTFFDHRLRSRIAQMVRAVRIFLRDCKTALVRKANSSSNRAAAVSTTAL
jgi:CelD/BcsL family acetyltransferase involved in cellulose biosynthesis